MQKKETFEEFIHQNKDLRDQAFEVIQSYYSQKRLNSPEAKANFTKPDLKQFPENYSLTYT